MAVCQKYKNETVDDEDKLCEKCKNKKLWKELEILARTLDKSYQDE